MDYQGYGDNDQDSDEELNSNLDYKINIDNCSFNNNYAQIEASVIFNSYGIDSGGNITLYLTIIS